MYNKCIPYALSLFLFVGCEFVTFFKIYLCYLCIHLSMSNPTHIITFMLFTIMFYNYKFCLTVIKILNLKLQKLQSNQQRIILHYEMKFSF